MGKQAAAMVRRAVKKVKGTPATQKKRAKIAATVAGVAAAAVATGVAVAKARSGRKKLW